MKNPAFTGGSASPQPPDDPEAVTSAGTYHRPLRAIRLKCLDCCGDYQAEVRRCEITSCTLWPYRMGHRPRREEVAP